MRHHQRRNADADARLHWANGPYQRMDIRRNYRAAETTIRWLPFHMAIARLVQSIQSFSGIQQEESGKLLVCHRHTRLPDRDDEETRHASQPHWHHGGWSRRLWRTNGNHDHHHAITVSKRLYHHQRTWPKIWQLHPRHSQQRSAHRTHQGSCARLCHARHCCR